MIQSAIRRPALALTLALVTAAPALAQNVTGTDPCPKGTICAASPRTAVTTTTPNTSSPSTPATTSTSDASTAWQALLSLLGLS